MRRASFRNRKSRASSCCHQGLRQALDMQRALIFIGSLHWTANCVPLIHQFPDEAENHACMPPGVADSFPATQTRVGSRRASLLSLSLLVYKDGAIGIRTPVNVGLTSFLVCRFFALYRPSYPESLLLAGSYILAISYKPFHSFIQITLFIKQFKMYRVSLSALALAFFLAVLTSALPAANNKRQGGMENVMDESFHVRFLKRFSFIDQCRLTSLIQDGKRFHDRSGLHHRRRHWPVNPHHALFQRLLDPSYSYSQRCVFFHACAKCRCVSYTRFQPGPRCRSPGCVDFFPAAERVLFGSFYIVYALKREGEDQCFGYTEAHHPIVGPWPVIRMIALDFMGYLEDLFLNFGEGKCDGVRLSFIRF